MLSFFVSQHMYVDWTHKHAAPLSCSYFSFWHVRPIPCLPFLQLQQQLVLLIIQAWRIWLWGSCLVRVHKQDFPSESSCLIGYIHGLTATSLCRMSGQPSDTAHTLFGHIVTLVHKLMVAPKYLCPIFFLFSLRRSSLVITTKLYWGGK